MTTEHVVPIVIDADFIEMLDEAIASATHDLRAVARDVRAALGVVEDDDDLHGRLCDGIDTIEAIPDLLADLRRAFDLSRALAEDEVAIARDRLSAV